MLERSPCADIEDPAAVEDGGGSKEKHQDIFREAKRNWEHKSGELHKHRCVEIDRYRQTERNKKAVAHVAHHALNVRSRPVPHFIGHLRFVAGHRIRLLTRVIINFVAVPWRRFFYRAVQFRWAGY